MGQNNSVAGGGDPANPDANSVVRRDVATGKGASSVLNLASDHVWMYDHSDEEVVSDSELNEGMWLRQVVSNGVDCYKICKILSTSFFLQCMGLTCGPTA